MQTQEIAIVQRQEAVSPGFYRMTLKAPQIASWAKPGQFVHVKCSPTLDPLLRRPISLHDFDAAAGTLTLLYQVVGRGTELLAKFQAGDQVDLMGPLGKGFTLPQSTSQVVVVGGGIGTAPLLPLVQALRQQGHQTHVVLGARTASLLLGVEAFRATGAEVTLTTDDGSAGRQGLVTDLLAEQIDHQQVDYVYACGPEPMLKAITQVAQQGGVSGEVSLEARMGCGVGACLACACKIRVAEAGKFDYKKVCVDGPVFDLQGVIWDD